MDPITIIGLVDASVDLALKCAGAVKKLNDIASKYKNSKLTIMSITGNLDAMQLAWDKIGAWIQAYSPGESSDDDGFVTRMTRFLETGELVMEALEEDLLGFNGDELGIPQRAKLLWNEGTFLDHQNRIRDQATTMSLLLQAIQLFTPEERIKLIRRSEKQFRKSDESAYSIVPSQMSSRLSMSTIQTDAQRSVENGEAMIYRRLSCEDDLFTARVYKRNYRHPMLLRQIKDKSQSISRSITAVTAKQQGNRDSHYQKKPKSDTGNDLIIGKSFNTISPEVPRTERRDMIPARDRPFLGIVWNSENNVVYDTFMSACEQGDLHTVRDFLRKGYEMHNHKIYYPGVDVWAIHVAVISGHVQIAQQLLQHGASLEQCTASRGSRPLHLAAESGNASMIELLLANGADISAINNLGEQPIYIAIRHGNIEALRVLVDGGAVLSCTDQEGRQPLHWAAESSDQPNIIEFLVSRGANINAWTEIHRNNQISERPLDIACRQDLVGNVRALLALGADTDDEFWDHESFVCRGPLFTAIHHGSLGALEMLLKHGSIDLNGPGHGGKPALHLAVNLIREDGPSSERLMCLLIRYKANIDTQDEHGDTALHYMTRKWTWGQSHTAILTWARILLDSGANPNAVNKDGETPLYLAAQDFQEKLSMLLIENGATLLRKIDEHCLILQPHVIAKPGSIKNVQFELQWHAKSLDYNNRIIDIKFRETAIHLMRTKFPLAGEGMIIRLEPRATPGGTQTLVREEIRVHSRSTTNETRRFDGEVPATESDAIRLDEDVNIMLLGASSSAESINFAPPVVPTRASHDSNIAYVSGTANPSEGAVSDSDPSLPPLGTSSPVS